MERMKHILEEKRPAKWEEIPDIDLYMDQVLSYMVRQHAGLELDENLTSAMINNYMKRDLLPRARGKKYNREHIAYLTAICLLKQVLSVADTGELLSFQIQQRQEEEVRSFYIKYTEIMDREFKRVSENLPQAADKTTLADAALRLAISSYAQKLACQQLVKALSDQKEPEK